MRSKRKIASLNGRLNTNKMSNKNSNLGCRDFAVINTVAGFGTDSVSFMCVAVCSSLTSITIPRPSLILSLSEATYKSINHKSSKRLPSIPLVIPLIPIIILIIVVLWQLPLHIPSLAISIR